jgi:hypothetical protein
MMMIPFKDMMFLHLLMGVGFTFFLALRAFQRHNNPHRRWFTFGGTPYSLGNAHKWVQWYCWAFVFEIFTSFLYAHTGMFYYELGMSVFEAMAVTVGGFIVDRLTGVLFLVEENDEDGDINLGVIPALTKAKEKIITIAPKMTVNIPSEQVSQGIEPTFTKENIRAKEIERFDNIIKGH